VTIILVTTCLKPEITWKTNPLTTNSYYMNTNVTNNQALNYECCRKAEQEYHSLSLHIVGMRCNKQKYINSREERQKALFVAGNSKSNSHFFFILRIKKEWINFYTVRFDLYLTTTTLTCFVIQIVSINTITREGFVKYQRSKTRGTKLSKKTE
jgi:hypothetical protein